MHKMLIGTFPNAVDDEMFPTIICNSSCVVLNLLTCVSPSRLVRVELSED
jgi:hypothetical protein